MKQLHRATAVGLLVLSLWVGWQALGLRFSTALGPGPGFFPLLMSMFLAGLSVALFVQARNLDGGPFALLKGVDRQGRIRLAAVVGTLLAVIALMEPLGYRLTMIAFFLTLPPALGDRRWPLLAVVAPAMSFGSYHVFRNLLGLPLPPGPFGI